MYGVRTSIGMSTVAPEYMSTLPHQPTPLVGSTIGPAPRDWTSDASNLPESTRAAFTLPGTTPGSRWESQSNSSDAAPPTIGVAQLVPGNDQRPMSERL